MTTDDRQARREQLVRDHMDSENRQAFDETLATFSRPRYELIPSARSIEGAEDVMAYWTSGRATFTDQRNELISLHHSNSIVIVEFWLMGTHLGGSAPTGRKFRCQMCAIFEFDDDDLITTERVYFDQATITRQLRGKTGA